MSTEREIMHDTARRAEESRALLVGLPQDLDGPTTVILRGLGFIVVREPLVAEACARIPVDAPLVVVVAEELRAQAREVIEDRAVAVGAEIVWLPPELSRADLLATLSNATVAATDRAFKRM
jgi:hypothetical protein